MWKRLKYFKYKLVLKKTLIDRYGVKEGTKKYNAILKFYKKKQKLSCNMDDLNEQ